MLWSTIVTSATLDIYSQPIIIIYVLHSAILGLRAGENQIYPSKFVKSLKYHFQQNCFLIDSLTSTEVAEVLHCRQNFDAYGWHDMQCSQALTMLQCLHIEPKAKVRRNVLKIAIQVGEKVVPNNLYDIGIFLLLN